MFQAIRKYPRISDQIAQQIEGKILNRRLNPGDRLPSENQLVQEFQCSRIVVREALRTLEGSGLITVKQGPYGGSFIKEFNLLSVSDYLDKAIKLGNISIPHLSQFRLSFEPSMVRLVASENVTKETLIRLEENIDETRTLYDKSKVTGYKNMDFHVILAEATQNPMFIILLNALRANLKDISPITKVDRSIRNPTLFYHERILKAVKEHNPDEAQAAMTHHLIELESLWEKMDSLKA